MEQKVSAARIRCNHARGGDSRNIKSNGAAALESNTEFKKNDTDGDVKVADIRDWDVAPPSEYFEELFRVSKNQIIWGGNYFNLPATRCFVVWRKLQIPTHDFSMSCVEYAWTSFNKNALSMPLVQIGELIGNLTDDLKEAHSHIPWVQIRALRNVLVHSYGKIDYG